MRTRLKEKERVNANECGFSVRRERETDRERERETDRERVRVKER